MELSIQPLSKWPEEQQSPIDSPFKSKWTQTLDLLEYELGRINASNVTLQTLHSAHDVRVDGRLRKDYRAPSYQGVILVFDVPRKQREANCEYCRKGVSIYGCTVIENKPLPTGERKWGHATSRDGRQVNVLCTDPNPRPVQMRFPAERFRLWKDNVRAIALTLEMLRAMERYGVNPGAQYVGFRKELPPAGREMTGMTLDEAANILAKHSDIEPRAIIANKGTMEIAYKVAAKATHPDSGGNQDEAARVNVAAQILRIHHEQRKAAGA